MKQKKEVQVLVGRIVVLIASLMHGCVLLLLGLNLRGPWGLLDQPIPPEAQVFSTPFLFLGATFILTSLFVFVRRPMAVMHALSVIHTIAFCLFVMFVGWQQIVFDVDSYFEFPFAYVYALAVGYFLLRHTNNSSIRTDCLSN